MVCRARFAGMYAPGRLKNEGGQTIERAFVKLVPIFWFHLSGRGPRRRRRDRTRDDGE